MNEKQKHCEFLPSDGFKFNIYYNELNRETHTFEIDMHSHDDYEIYINLSGDVAFAVKNRLYPLTRGDVVFSRPGEYHHCVYRSNADHKFFWILFSCERSELLEDFFKDSDENFISLSIGNREELLLVCKNLLNKDLSEIDKYCGIFRVMQLVKGGMLADRDTHNILPNEVTLALQYIDMHISDDITGEDIAKASFVSKSTIERRFKQYLGLKPFEYIRKKRLTMAAGLLRNGSSVLQAGFDVGFKDNSNFIKIFREHFGITPHQYKQRKPI